MSLEFNMTARLVLLFIRSMQEKDKPLFLWCDVIVMWLGLWGAANSLLLFQVIIKTISTVFYFWSRPPLYLVQNPAILYEPDQKNRKKCSKGSKLDGGLSSSSSSNVYLIGTFLFCFTVWKETQMVGHNKWCRWAIECLLWKVSLDLQSRCWSPGQCLRARLLLHFQTSWLNCLKALLLPNCKESQGIEIKYMEKKTSRCEILTRLPVWRPLVKFCGCWFVHFYPHRPVEESEVNLWQEKDGKWNLWLWQRSFTSVEEKWRRLLCCLRMSWTGWPGCHLDYPPEEGSSAPDLACLTARLRRTSHLATNDAVPDLSNICVTWFTYRYLPRSLCF